MVENHERLGEPFCVRLQQRVRIFIESACIADHSDSGRFRLLLISERLCFPSSRLRREPRVGRVGRRMAGGNDGVSQQFAETVPGSDSVVSLGPLLSCADGERRA